MILESKRRTGRMVRPPTEAATSSRGSPLQLRYGFVALAPGVLGLTLSTISICAQNTPEVVQTARDVRGAPAVEPLQNEPPAKLVVDPPVAEPLLHGRVVIQYRTESLHLAPVFGPVAQAVSPPMAH